MKFKLPKAAFLIWFVAGSAMGQEITTATKSFEAPDKAKLSYALGMHMGLQLKQAKQADANVDVNVAAQAVNDVFEGKPTKIQESEVPALLNRGRVNNLTEQAEPDKEKVSYAGGMRIALQLKRTGADLDGNVIAQAIRDVLDDKPTKIQEAEIAPLLMQGQAYVLAKQAEKNRADGDAFLAKNAKEPGVTVLPDGLQYRVLQAGTDEMPATDDLIIVKYRSRLIDGTEFDHHDHFLTRVNGGIKGWQEALQHMKIGSKWQIFVPSDLAYGSQGEPFRHIGPDATLVFDLELVSIAAPGDRQVSTGVGHGLDVVAAPDEPVK
jgi:FKBP-type peptidyl-prolyl cis-trans isomerase